MLMEELIKKNKYFQAIKMKDNNLLDPLTGTIVRKHIIAYVKYLIKNNRRFYLGIMDIDNFKMINDTYGHAAGDEILAGVSKNVMNVVPENYVLGRYGGDEFLFVVEGYDKYEQIYNDMKSTIYRSGVRKPITLSRGQTITITSTSGFACYPVNAKNYDDLFNSCDKCLYRGKMKGRNCYIVYVESLHKNIDIAKTHKIRLPERISRMYKIFDSYDKKTRIDKTMNHLTNDISVTGIQHVVKGKIKASYIKTPEYGEVSVLSDEMIQVMVGDDLILKVSDIAVYKDIAPDFYNFCYENNLLSFLIIKADMANKDMGYVLVYDSDFKRLWSDDDEALFMVFTKMISAYNYYGA